MELKILQEDMIAAMKARDKQRKEAISGLVSAVKKAGIDAGCRDDIPEDMVNAAILKEQKIAKEQLDQCPDSRQDLKAEYQFKYDVISEYAPKMMSEDEIKEYITENFSEIIAAKDKGAVMKAIMPVLKGKADGKLINRIVGELLK
ncbi:MAG: GatB/YqeY domain-containing protein [Lachnospiraceae bacterium]|nr:GatB/YqeY domain-containing protein [Lachnospiraceae bacterium]